MARLSRENMLSIINTGGSVIFNGQSFTKDNINLLPSDADIAVQYNDVKEVENIEKSIDEKIAELLAEKAKLSKVEDKSEDKVTDKESKKPAKKTE